MWHFMTALCVCSALRKIVSPAVYYRIQLNEVQRIHFIIVCRH